MLKKFSVLIFVFMLCARAASAGDSIDASGFITFVPASTGSATTIQVPDIEESSIVVRTVHLLGVVSIARKPVSIASDAVLVSKDGIPLFSITSVSFFGNAVVETTEIVGDNLVITGKLGNTDFTQTVSLNCNHARPSDKSLGPVPTLIISAINDYTKC